MIYKRNMNKKILAEMRRINQSKSTNIIIILTAIILIIMVLTSCCSNVEVKKAPKGYVKSRYIGQPEFVKLGQNYEFRGLLHNGDSLFFYYFVESNGNEKDRIYYTSNNRTKDINWNVSSGKSDITMTNTQQ